MTDKILGFVFAETTITPAETIRGLKLAYDAAGRPTLMCISNWDKDPRELVDIPEVTEWCRQVIRLGGLSYVAGIWDVPSDTNIYMHLPPQMLLVACAGWPGAERIGALEFRYNFPRIADMELQYRPKDFATATKATATG